VLAGRAVWSINSTAVGGGVAEMLRTMLPYARAGGFDARWLIVRAGADCFRVTRGSTTFSPGISGTAVHWERRSETSTNA
jgi:trehalose synthase